MTILTETERGKARIWYREGWSFQEITAQLLLNRNTAQHLKMLREVELVLTGICKVPLERRKPSVYNVK